MSARWLGYQMFLESHSMASLTALMAFSKSSFSGLTGARASSEAPQRFVVLFRISHQRGLYGAVADCLVSFPGWHRWAFCRFTSSSFTRSVTAAVVPPCSRPQMSKVSVRQNWIFIMFSITLYNPLSVPSTRTGRFLFFSGPVFARRSPMPEYFRFFSVVFNSVPLH